MGKTRLDLHEKLCEILGSRNVYFKAPSRMKYPCIKYSKSRFDTKRANNSIYKKMNLYSVTFITEDLDSEIPDALLSLPYSYLKQTYVSDNLNHSVFDIYF